MGVAVLSETDFDRITDRFKAVLLEARAEGGVLPCYDHGVDLGRLQASKAKVAALLGIIVAVASLLGSAAAGALFDRVAEKALQAAPAATSPVPVSPQP